MNPTHVPRAWSLDDRSKLRAGGREQWIVLSRTSAIGHGVHVADRAQGLTGTGRVGRTHTIVRLQTRIRRKDGTENFGGFVYVLDGFPQRDFALWVFMCPINFILFCLLSCLFSGYHAKGYHTPSILHGLSRPGLSRLYHHCTATTPVYIYPGYHTIVLSSIPGLSHPA